MPFDVDHLQKPFRKLLDNAKPSRKLADPERVHKLRTTTRRVEAILGVLDLPKKSRTKTLLNDLKKVRRIAGVVRDMDVLTGKAADVSPADERGCQIRLLEHLGVERHRAGKKLISELKARGPRARRILKDCAKQLEDLVSDPTAAARMEGEVRGNAELRTNQLRSFAILTRRNLHEFRKQAKQLRYVLQIATPRDEALLKALSDMQTAIGEWHDWEELLGIAKEVLRHGRKCGMVRELQLHTDESFDAAMKNANAVRKRYFTRGSKPVTLRIVPRAA